MANLIIAKFEVRLGPRAAEFSNDRFVVEDRQANEASVEHAVAGPAIRQGNRCIRDRRPPVGYARGYATK